MANVLTTEQALHLPQGTQVKIDLGVTGIMVRSKVDGHTRENYMPAVPGRFLFGTVVSGDLVLLDGTHPAETRRRLRFVTVDPRRHDVYTPLELGQLHPETDEGDVDAAHDAEDRTTEESLSESPAPLLIGA